MERVATSKLKTFANGRRWETALQMLIELPKQEMEVGLQDDYFGSVSWDQGYPGIFFLGGMQNYPVI